jgi:uncharacterized protein YnzC (UPF0291/DUF896 family)
MAKNEIDITILNERYAMWDNAGKLEKGIIIRTFAHQIGLTPSSVYRRFQDIKRGVDRTIVAGYTGKKRQRKSDDELAEIRRDMITIANIKVGGKVGKQGYGTATDLAIIAAENRGWIERGKYSRSTVDRWLKAMGISINLIDTPKVATELYSPYPNHCWIVDATVKNHYFLNIKEGGRLEYRNDIKYDASHGIDIMETQGLKRIWDYFIVDNFSKAYMMMSFAPDPRTPGAIKGGENTQDWITFLTWCFLQSDNSKIPIHGLPKIIFSDKGSGLESKAMTTFLGRLGIEVRTHMPGHASAKGAVESRIGAYKRSYGVTINRSKLYELDELRDYDNRFMIYDNQKKGLFQKWVEGTKEHPITVVTQKAIQDALVSERIVTIGAYGCFTLNKEQHFVSNELPRGTKVILFTNKEGNRCVQSDDGRIFDVKPYGRAKRNIETYEIMDGRGDDIQNQDVHRLREEIKKTARAFKEKINPADYLVETNLSFFPPKTAGEVETHVAMAPDKVVRVEDAVRYVLNETGLTEEEIGSDDMQLLREAFIASIANYGYVSSDILHRLCNIFLSSGTEG